MARSQVRIPQGSLDIVMGKFILPPPGRGFGQIILWIKSGYGALIMDQMANQIDGFSRSGTGAGEQPLIGIQTNQFITNGPWRNRGAVIRATRLDLVRVSSKFVWNVASLFLDISA